MIYQMEKENFSTKNENIIYNGTFINNKLLLVCFINYKFLSKK